MSAAEAIEAIGAKADPETSAALLDAVTRIYEASAFQDITGQRITKVVRALQHIEGRIAALAAGLRRRNRCGTAAAAGR